MGCIKSKIYDKNVYEWQSFKQDISKWNVSNVKDLDKRFDDIKYFCEELES